MILKPLIGIDNIILGSSKQSIFELLGQPESTNSDEWPDGTISESWLYLDSGLTLNFDSDNNYRLSTINTTSRQAELEGLKLVGKNINSIIDKHSSIILDEDLSESVKDYVYPEKEISFWVVNDLIENITVFPEYDKSKDLPIWPVT
ncbi:MAG: hypothetical protein OQK98_12455 [Gammaproteobacteria bacterium]|nr:hypothetical protein [Gammaproteobacteria bacterium]